MSIVGSATPAPITVKAKAFHSISWGCAGRKSRRGLDDYPRDRLPEFLFSPTLSSLQPRSLMNRVCWTTAFRSMKPTAFYICVSRGAIAQTSALGRACGKLIAGAGLDAHAIEPLPAEPVLKMSNVI